MLYISLLKKNVREIRRNVWSGRVRQKPFINGQRSVPDEYKTVSKEAKTETRKKQGIAIYV